MSPGQLTLQSVQALAQVGMTVDTLVKLTLGLDLLLALIGNCSIVAFLFVFPTGTFTPRWTVPISGVWEKA